MAEESSVVAAGDESQPLVEAESEPKSTPSEGDPGPTSYPVFNNRFRSSD